MKLTPKKCLGIWALLTAAIVFFAPMIAVVGLVKFVSALMAALSVVGLVILGTFLLVFD